MNPLSNDLRFASIFGDNFTASFTCIHSHVMQFRGLAQAKRRKTDMTHARRVLPVTAISFLGYSLQINKAFDIF